MKRTILKNVGIGLCFLLSTGTVCAQNYPGKVKNAQGIEVTYQSNYKGKARPGHLLMTVSSDRVSLTNVWPEQNDRPNPRPEDKTPVTGSYIDYTTRQAYRRAELPNGQVISAVTPFEFGKGFTQTGEGKHLGMNCKILRTSINSNTIEVWYTNDIPFRGTPQANVGVPDGLVLRVVRNGDMIQEATHITPLKKGKDVLPQSWGESMDAADYQYTINQSGVITIPVFDQQSICFNNAKLPEVLEDGVQYSADIHFFFPWKVCLPSHSSLYFCHKTQMEKSLKIMNFTLYQYKYISKDDSTYLKGLAILIMICLHVFGSRAVNLPAYQQMDDFVFMGRPLSFCLSRFCSICVHIYILLSGYGLFIVYRRKVEKGVGMKNLKRISLLMAKVILVGTIFYPISLFYPDLQWHFSFMECVRMLLGYSGNYEWWFLRPYLIIAALSPFLLKGINKKSVICLTISLLLYFLTKYLIYFHDFHLFVILEQVFILCLPFFLGAILAKYGILAWAKSISQSHFAVFLSITVLMVMLLYKFYFPSGIIDPFISAVFVICCIILTNIVKSGGCIIYLPL